LYFCFFCNKYQYLYLFQDDFERDDQQAGNKSNDNESAPMMGEPVTVQPRRESDGNQPIISQPVVLQPRSNGDSPNKQSSSV